MINLEINSSCLAERLGHLIDHNACTIVDRDDLYNDKAFVESSVKSINAQVSWSQYDHLVISDLWRQNKYALFALKNERIVGYVQFSAVVGRPGLCIRYIAVDPSVGRGGIGKNLMFAALAKISQLGHSYANLSYRSNQEHLVRFYNTIAAQGGLTKVETDMGVFSNGDPKRLVVYNLT